MSALDAEMDRARAQLRTARARSAMYAAAYGGAVERDLDRRLAAALRQVRWLVRLVTAPDGIVLDPFAGSGTTVEACVLEGMRCLAIEREESYLPLIEARLARVGLVAL